MMIKKEIILLPILLNLGIVIASLAKPKINALNIYAENGADAGPLGQSLNLIDYGYTFYLQVDVISELPDTKVEFFLGSTYVKDGSNLPFIAPSPFVMGTNDGNLKYSLLEYMITAGTRKSITIRLVDGDEAMYDSNGYKRNETALPDGTVKKLDPVVYDVKTYIFDVSGNDMLSDLTATLSVVEGMADRANAFKVPVANGGVVNLRPYNIIPPYQLSLLATFNKPIETGYKVNTVFTNTKNAGSDIQREALHSEIVNSYDRVLDFLTTPGVKTATVEVQGPDGNIVFSEYFIFEILNSWMSNPVSILQPSYVLPLP